MAEGFAKSLGQVEITVTSSGLMEELYKFTLLLRGEVDNLTDRYSERKEAQLKQKI